MNYDVVRILFFVFSLVILSFCEVIFPRRKLRYSKMVRWSNNLSLVVLNTVVLRILFPTAAVGVALWVSSNQVSLLNYFYMPEWLKV